MLPSERITLIKKIAARFLAESWEDMRLILRQFGLDMRTYYPDEDTVDPFMTAVRSIEDAPDETLLGLHSHFFGDTADPPSAQGTRRARIAHEVWAQPSRAVGVADEDLDRLRLFISHTALHKAEAGALQLSFAINGVAAFVAHADIHPTREWQDVIESALDTCDALLALLTPDFHESLWTDQEVGFCVGRSVLIVPVRVGRDPHGFIGKYQAVQGAGKEPHAIAAEVTDLLVDHPLTAERMAPSVLQTFARSYSFDNARANLERLMRIPDVAWTAEFAQIVRNAMRENDQLSQANAPPPSGSGQWIAVSEIVEERLRQLGL